MRIRGEAGWQEADAADGRESEGRRVAGGRGRLEMGDRPGAGRDKVRKGRRLRAKGKDEGEHE